MKKSSYGQFFKTAQKVRLGDETKDRVRFSVKPAAATGTDRSVETPEAEEQRLRRTFNMNKKKGRARPPFPWKALGGLSVILVLAGAYAMDPDVSERLLSKIEIGSLWRAEAADHEAAKKSAGPEAKVEKSADAQPPHDKSSAAEGRSSVVEDLGHYEKLKQRKEELDAREKELAELEEELQRQKGELDKRIVQLEEMRGQIGQVLKDRVEVDQEKVTKLGDLYSNMKHKQAAEVIGTVNEDLAGEG